jgi:hypothetical protein
MKKVKNTQKVNKSLTLYKACLAIVFLITSMLSLSVFSAVTVTVGPTEIPQGNALDDNDITVKNELFAIAFAVKSASPWGVARGGIIDVAEIHNGKISEDRVSLIDFIPNNWSSWPTTFQQVSIVKNTPEEVIIKTVRDWHSVIIKTTYSIKTNDNMVHISTTMHNEGKKNYSDLLSGYVLWPDGGHLFGVPGLAGIGKGSLANATAKWNAVYDQQWSVGLHAPYADEINYDARDLYKKHNLAPGQSQNFKGWLQISDKGDLSTMVEGQINLENLASGTVVGTVSTTSGKRVELPAVIVLKNNKPYSWSLGKDGHYALTLPVGEYQLYATAKDFSNSNNVTIQVNADKKVTANFDSLLSPGEIEFQVSDANTHKALDAKISIAQGSKPLIAYFGKTTFFTELSPIGHKTISIAPGQYQFKIDYADGFKAKASYIELEVKSAQHQRAKIDIQQMVLPEEARWFSADLHHHADVLDGNTTPEYVLRSQLAAGLDLSFLSDHNTSKNHLIMKSLSDRRGIPFIPSMEISPSWGHFNAYPLNLAQSLDIDTSIASIDQVLASAKRLGAKAIQVNHPSIEYGYLTSVDNDTVPGGFNPNFDLLEINSETHYIDTINRAWSYWNEGKAYYLSAGSDTHNVWNSQSGKVRAYVNVPQPLSQDSFIDNLKKGHSYITFGPLIFSKHLFGSNINVKAGEALDLSFDVQAVNGLKSIQLIEQGKIKQQKHIANSSKLTPLTFSMTPTKNTWYSLVVEDGTSNQAFSNPIWITVIN